MQIHKYHVSQDQLNVHDKVDKSIPQLKTSTRIPEHISDIKTSSEFIARLRAEPSPISLGTAIEFRNALDKVKMDTRAVDKDAGSGTGMGFKAFEGKDYQMADYNKLLELRQMAKTHGIESFTIDQGRTDLLRQSDFQSTFQIVAKEVAISNVAEKISSSHNPFKHVSYSQAREKLDRDLHHPDDIKRNELSKTKNGQKLSAELQKLYTADSKF